MWKLYRTSLKNYEAIFIFQRILNLCQHFFPPVNVNMHSCPVKSALLPLQLLEYGVMQCLVIRPKLRPRRMGFKILSM